MNMEFALVISTGLCWTMVAIIVSEAKQQQCPIPHFYLIGSLVALALLLPPLLAGEEDLMPMIAHVPPLQPLCFFFSAMLNGAGQSISMNNLQQGGRALAYAIPQLAFIFPYVISIVLWNQAVTACSILGMIMMIAAVLFLTLHRHDQEKALLSKHRILIACLAMTLMGGSQILMTLPTQGDTANSCNPLAGACIILAGNVVFFSSWSLGRRNSGLSKTTASRTFRYGIAWGCAAASSYATLLPALKALGKRHQAGIVFPIGIGILIVAYTCFTSVRYKETLDGYQKLAFAGIVGGIFLMKLVA